MFFKKIARGIACFACVLTLVQAMNISASAVTVTGVSGVEITCDSNGTISESNGTVTVKAAGSFTTRKTTVITITNTSGSTATVSFDIATSKIDSDVSTIDDLGGKFSQNLTAGQSVTYKLCSTRFDVISNTGVATLSNFSVVQATTKYDVALSYDTNCGSVTIDGAAAAPGTHQIDSAALSASAKSGCVFLGWIDPATGKIISKENPYNVVVTGAMSIQAVFTNASSSAWFLVPAGTDKFMFDDLNEAATKAASCDKVVIPAADGTLPAGNYTISAGVTLLIPYDTAHTLCTDTPTVIEGSYTTPTKFRTLTMASGANITVNGAISVSGTQSAKYGYNGMPSGPLGFISMNANSKITVENGANLYVWGYITGSGSVEVKSGGTVHEDFQIADYRGGDATNSIVDEADTYGVFPFNQYYVQNVEVPMTLHSGATEKGFSSVTVTLVGKQVLSVPFIGTTDNSMFRITSGYIVKDYLEGTGRTNVQIYGGLTVNEVTLELETGLDLLGSVTIETAKYALPVPHHFTLSLESGSITMNQTMALLPGSELTIKQGTTCTLGANKKIHVYDWDQWIYNDGANGYSGTSNLPYIKTQYVPGGDGTTGREKDAQIQVDGTVNVSAGSAYVTSGGANIFSTGTGVVQVAATSDATAYQVITNGTDVDSWPEIAMQPAILQNGDGSDVITKGFANTYTYSGTGTEGRWIPAKGFAVLNNGVYYPYGDIDTAVSESQNNSAADIYAYEDGTITGPLDLNGRDIKVGGNDATIAVNGIIYDTKTDAYNSAAAGSIELTTAPAGIDTYNGKHYVAVNTTGNTYQFHRVGLSVTAARIDIYNGAIYLSAEATMRSSATGLGALETLGFTFGKTVTNQYELVTTNPDPITKGEVTSYLIYGSYTKQLESTDDASLDVSALLNGAAASDPRTIAWKSLLEGQQENYPAIKTALANLTTAS